MNDCVDASASALETERELRREVEARARRAEDRVVVLQNENAMFMQGKAKAEKEAARRIAEAKAWQEKLRGLQDAQEFAVRNIRTIEELEKENNELKTAMHAFARGSTEMIVLQMELIIPPPIQWIVFDSPIANECNLQSKSYKSPLTTERS